MSELTGISDFFSRIECPYQVYEMGRLVLPVAADRFYEFEQTQTPWPYPFLRQAWFAVHFWVPGASRQIESDKESEKSYVWFLKFPLDEQAKLNLSARDDFLRRLFSALKHYLTHTETDPVKKIQSLESIIKDNPHGFTPNQERMANFHARVLHYLNLPASRFYQPALEYLTGKNGFEQWCFVGYQGLADVAARLGETFKQQPVADIVAQALHQLPNEPLMVQLKCLENYSTPATLSQEMLHCLQIELDKKSAAAAKHNSPNYVHTTLIAAFVRGLAQSTEEHAKRQILLNLLKSDYASELEILAAISAKSWPVLSDSELLNLFLEALAKNVQGQDAFNAIISDLLFIPGMRGSILQQFRSPERSSVLTRAIGDFLNQAG